jgi:phosphatidylinositol 3,5-bisphosphate 5-phosphatase
MMFFGCNVAFSSMPVFLPTIIREMGYTSLTAQALSAPPYLFSFIMVLVIAYLSDRHSSRSGYIVFASLLSALGYFLIALASSRHMGPLYRYIPIYFACAGFFSAITLIITWTLNNQETSTGRGTGMAMLNIIGQCGPLVGTRLYPDRDAPWYVPGMTVCAVCMVGVGFLAVGLRLVLRRANRNKIREYERRRLSDEGHMTEPFIFIL